MQGSQRSCSKINNIAEDVSVLWYSSKFLLTGESLEQSEIQFNSIEMLLSDRAPPTRKQKTQRHLEKGDRCIWYSCCFHTASQTTSARVTRLSKALQVLELEGMETKRKGKTVYVLQAELNSGRLNWSENIMSIN